ncbi:MAG: dTDP-4-dehydrorhamnose 3,5-epimerase [Candidatus Brocadiaceae bacterium]|nr:dTDP-4-dehydrorhamnose 3,5-epimerase [Candidatus Brocadiaceae bacterium]
MSCKFKKTAFSEVLLIEPDVFRDSRGFFMEVFHREKYAEAGISQIFAQDNHSHSKKGTVRGLHYQFNHPQGKLVYVITGEIFDVAVDIRRGSPTFGAWTGIHLSAENKQQLFVPEGFAHGFCVLSECADVMYKCTDLYYPDDDFGILWSDKNIGIRWPVNTPIVSEKDRKHPRLNEIPESRLPIYQ